MGVVENRISNLMIHVLIGASVLFFLPYLSLIPMAVLFGLFLFMGIGTLGGNQFVDRFKLWITDPSLYPPTHYIRAVPLRFVHAYTGIQFVCLAVLRKCRRHDLIFRAAQIAIVADGHLREQEEAALARIEGALTD